MSIYIDNPEIESALEALAMRQDVPTSKRAMALAILKDAVDAVEESGDDRAWKYVTEAGDHRQLA